MSAVRQFEVITSCSLEGYKAYGRRMVESFYKHWPADVVLRLYSESEALASRAPHLRGFPEWLNEFRTRHGDSKLAAGLHSKGRMRGHYNYRFDALRFAFKTAAVIDSIEESEADILIWIDADTVTHAPVSIEFLRELAPTGAPVISWLAREKNYPECGFYMLNLRNPDAARLAHAWKDLYTSDRIFHLPEWHDSYVLAECIRALGMNTKSISGEGAKTGHPFINGPLGAVMDHMKGNRKIQGRSNWQDLRVERTEPYWKRT